MKKALFITLAVVLCGVMGAVYAARYRQLSIPRIKSETDKSLDQYYAEGQDNRPVNLTEEQQATVTFLAVGDISLSRSVAQVIKEKADPLYPFRGVEKLLSESDFNFGNLESPFSSKDSFNPGPTLVFNAPKSNAIGLARYNFKVVNLANNHAFDQGLDGIMTTARVLDENGILHMGTGSTPDAAWMPAVVEKNGIKIGFIGASYASINDGGKTANNYVARIEDTKRLTAEISKLKSFADFVVVTMHAGTEYTVKANEAQIQFAHAAVDAGADIVIGAHPHWVQEREAYCPGGTKQNRIVPDDKNPITMTGENFNGNCRPIYYSLGNFMFDQSWSEPTKHGLALKITISKTKRGNNTVLPEGATGEDLQGSRNTARLEAITEVPVYITGNCCPHEKSSGEY